MLIIKRNSTFRFKMEAAPPTTNNPKNFNLYSGEIYKKNIENRFCHGIHRGRGGVLVINLYSIPNYTMHFIPILPANCCIFKI